MLTIDEADVNVRQISQRPVMALLPNKNIAGVERMEDLAYLIWQVSDLSKAPFEVFMLETSKALMRSRGAEIDIEDVRDFVLDLASCQWLRILTCDEVGIAKEEWDGVS